MLLFIVQKLEFPRPQRTNENRHNFDKCDSEGVKFVKRLLSNEDSSTCVNRHIDIF